MEAIKFYITGTLCLLLCWGCRKMEAPPGEYVHYVENKDNGLRVEKLVGDVKFTAQYKPPAYIILKESKAPLKSATELNDDLKDLAGYEYFTFSIGSAVGKKAMIERKDGQKDFDARISYCNSEMQHDFLMIDGNDTLPCKIYEFERNYGMAPSNNFLLGFENKKKSVLADKTLVYFDRLYNTGLLKFTIKASDLKQVPKLKAF